MLHAGNFADWISEHLLIVHFPIFLPSANSSTDWGIPWAQNARDHCTWSACFNATTGVWQLYLRGGCSSNDNSSDGSNSFGSGS